MSSQEKWEALIASDYANACANGEADLTRPSYISEHIFDLAVYDGELAELFGGNCLLVAKAITDRTTFEFIKQSEEHYRTYIITCNLPFFASRIDWGGSVRGAWWGCEQEPVCFDAFEFTDSDDFERFISALYSWAFPEEASYEAS